MKENTVYNHLDNLVYVRSNKDYINIICHEEEQVQKVMDKMSTDNCILSEYEEWDDDSDTKWLLTFKILDEFETYPDYN
tara:strand:+ start:278 stop:514 length:237 start_codon:yes stop_codon:yes gene_type:complete